MPRPEFNYLSYSYWIEVNALIFALTACKWQNVCRKEIDSYRSFVFRRSIRSGSSIFTRTIRWLSRCKTFSSPTKATTAISSSFSVFSIERFSFTINFRKGLCFTIRIVKFHFRSYLTHLNSLESLNSFFFIYIYVLLIFSYHLNVVSDKLRAQSNNCFCFIIR